jgi:hypothetical protein
VCEHNRSDRGPSGSQTSEQGEPINAFLIENGDLRTAPCNDELERCIIYIGTNDLKRMVLIQDSAQAYGHQRVEAAEYQRDAT